MKNECHIQLFTMPSGYNSYILLLFCFTTFCSQVEGLNCGYPGSPAFGKPHPLRDTYRPGEFVNYNCTLGYSLQGHVCRQCQENGTWSGALPVCDRNISSVNHVAYSGGTLRLYGAHNAIDGDRTSCTYTCKTKPRWIRVDLKEPYLIQAVAVTVPKNYYATSSAHFIIYIISVSDRWTPSYQQCAYFNGKISTETVRLTCSDGSIYGQYIHIADNRSNVDSFGICEIDVFVKRDSYDCGEPERPVHSFNFSSGAAIVQYRCVYGYKLEGPSERRCLPDGQWSNEQPVCRALLGLADEVESALPTGLTVGMVIVVLLLLVTFLLIFLIRRKGLSRGVRNHSLSSKGTSSSCVGSTNDKPTLYDNDTFYASIDRNEEYSADINGVCVYEEIGQVSNLRGKKKFKDREKPLNSSLSVPPVYAQVDLEEKWKLRLSKSFCDKFDCNTLSGDGQYHSVETPTFYEFDSEPVKLREVPPIPTDDY